MKADLAKVFEKGTTLLSRSSVRTDSPRIFTMESLISSESLWVVVDGECDDPAYEIESAHFHPATERVT